MAGRHFDVLLVGGRVADGSGQEMFAADVAVRGDRIEAVGSLSDAYADTVLDCEGLVVAPGFIDLHTHADNPKNGGIVQCSSAENYLRQGVTTIVGGNCGGGPVPMGRHLAQVEKLSTRQNYACLVGHNSVRRHLELPQHPANPRELLLIRDAVEDAMREGAVGVASGYFPAWVETEELVAAGDGAGRHGGIYASHIRDEGEGLLDAIAEAVEVCRSGAVPVQISHIKAWGPSAWDLADDAISLVESARAEGLQVSADRYPYLAAAGGGHGHFIGPQASKLASERGGVEHLTDRDIAEAVERLVAERLESFGGPDKVVLAPWNPEGDIDNKSLARLAEEWAVTPARAAIRVAQLNIEGLAVHYFAMREDNLRKFLARPWTMAASDGALRPFEQGISHPRNYGTFPRVLGKYAREQGLFSMEHAVQKMTSMPADKIGLKHRGLVAEGYIADLAVFDPETVRDRATFDNGHQYPVGIPHVLLGGRLPVRDSKCTNALLGRVLRGGRDACLRA
jgi:N-acyl-D-amino-acid deacylase